MAFIQLDYDKFTSVTNSTICNLVVQKLYAHI